MKRKYVYKNEQSEISEAMHILAYICIAAMIVLLLNSNRKLFEITGYGLGVLAVTLFAADRIICRNVYARRRWHKYVRENGEEALGTVMEVIPVTITNERGETHSGNTLKVFFKSPINWEERKFVTDTVIFPIEEGMKYFCRVHEVSEKPDSFSERDWFGNFIADGFVAEKEDK